MALEYSFKLSSDIDSAQSLRLLAERLDATWDQQGYVYKEPDILIKGWDISPGRSTEVTEEAFYFTPNLGLLIRCQHDSDYDAFCTLMLRATMLLLERGRDAVLLFNGEIVVFQRLGGRLVFNTGYELWSEETLLKEVHVPFERRSLPSPLL